MIGIFVIGDLTQSLQLFWMVMQLLQDCFEIGLGLDADATGVGQVSFGGSLELCQAPLLKPQGSSWNRA